MKLTTILIISIAVGIVAACSSVETKGVAKVRCDNGADVEVEFSRSLKSENPEAR